MTLILDTINNVTLEDLNNYNVLHVNKCSDVSTLVELLSINTTIKVLRFIDCIIGPIDVIKIGAMIEKNNTITTLDLYGSIEIGNGFISIIKALEFNKSIVVLDLSYNFMYNSNYFALCDVLKKNTTLKYLYLSKTDSSEIVFGIGRLIHEMKDNQNIVLLDVSNNTDDDDIKRVIHDTLQVNKNIRILY